MRPSHFLLIAALLLCGCEGSPHPLSAPDALPVDPALIGEWEIVSPEAPGSAQLRVLVFNDHEYYVEYDEMEESDTGWVLGDRYRLRMFMTGIGEGTFANLTAIGADSDASWFFMLVDQPGPDELLITPVDDDLYEQLGDLEDPEAVRTVLAGLLPDVLERDNQARFRRVAAGDAP